MPANLGGYDQGSAVLAESFAPYVSDAVFQANRVVKVLWDDAQREEEGRYLALPILTNKNATAQSFGQYDTLASGPQSLYSVAAFPWSFYQAAVTLDYITTKLVRGPNMRVDNLTTQIETAIGSLTDLIGNDVTNLTKGSSTQTAQPAFGIPEACDNGTLFNVYGNIARTGTNSFANWQGNVVQLSATNLGTAFNDAPRDLFFRNYAACSVGSATPTDIFGNQQAVASYMFALDSQIRVSPGDVANPYLSDPHMLAAKVIGDNHFLPILGGVGGTKIGYNFYYVNANHTKIHYFGEKGFDFVPWIDTPNVLSKTARYITGFQCASDNPRLNGFLGPVNDLVNL
uniref:Phage major capsid protein n=1 Tax=mine drainage metagenome TaxID=410659 RepID=E6QP88_9ZZZZ